jgi:hypothetical protein
VSIVDLLRRDARELGFDGMLFHLLPCLLSLVVTRVTRWGLLPLSVALTVPASWIVVRVLHLSRANGDNQVLVVGVATLALLGWITLAATITVGLVRLHLRRHSIQRGVHL